MPNKNILAEYSMSSSTVISPFAGLPISEVVPDSMEVRGVSKSSLLTGRRRIRFTPQNGTTQNPGGIVQFVLADSTSLLDVNSMVLSFNATCSGTTATPTLDDGPAWCRRIQVSLNGQLVDDTDNAHRNANAQMYLNGDQSWYNSSGSFAGYWALNPALGTSMASGTSQTAASVPLRYGDVSGAAVAAIARYSAAAYNGNPAGMSLAVPLGLLSSSLRCRQYWPLSQMGEMVVQITLASAQEALLQAATGSAPNYVLSDIFVECDLVQPHYMYQELLNRVTQHEGEHGLVIPVETTIVAQGQSISSGSQNSSVVVSRATNNLRKVIVTTTPTAALASTAYPSVSTFPCSSFQSFQVRVGSLYFPSQPANSLARAWWMSQGAFGEPVNDRGGVVNWNSYGQTTNSSTGVCTSYQGVSTPGAKWADSFVLAYDFDNYKGGEKLDADGISVLGQAGSQLIVQLQYNAAEAQTPTISLIATKYISLKDGTLKIIGV